MSMSSPNKSIYRVRMQNLLDSRPLTVKSMFGLLIVPLVICLVIYGSGNRISISEPATSIAVTTPNNTNTSSAANAVSSKPEEPNVKPLGNTVACQTENCQSSKKLPPVTGTFEDAQIWWQSDCLNHTVAISSNGDSYVTGKGKIFQADPNQYIEFDEQTTIAKDQTSNVVFENELSVTVSGQGTLVIDSLGKIEFDGDGRIQIDNCGNVTVIELRHARTSRFLTYNLPSIEAGVDTRLYAYKCGTIFVAHSASEVYASLCNTAQVDGGTLYAHQVHKVQVESGNAIVDRCTELEKSNNSKASIVSSPAPSTGEFADAQAWWDSRTQNHHIAIRGKGDICLFGTGKITDKQNNVAFTTYIQHDISEEDVVLIENKDTLHLRFDGEGTIAIDDQTNLEFSGKGSLLINEDGTMDVRGDGFATLKANNCPDLTVYSGIKVFAENCGIVKAMGTHVFANNCEEALVDWHGNLLARNCKLVTVEHGTAEIAHCEQVNAKDENAKIIYLN